MRRWSGLAFFGFLVLAAAAGTGGGVTPFAGGSGTPADPYQISDVQQLQAMSGNLAASYVLLNDIDASATVGWNGGAGFEPIGSQNLEFAGTFDGRGYKITGLTINRPSECYVSLFGHCHGALIRNVGLADVQIIGVCHVAALVGAFDYGQIEKCWSTGFVRGSYYSVGGLVGWLYYAGIRASYSEAEVIGNNYVGGLVGCYYGAPGPYCLEDSYATGDVTGWDSPGGLVGNIQGGSGPVARCYSTGRLHPVPSAFGVGGLIGNRIGYPPGAPDYTSDSYWDVETSGMTVSAGGTGKTTAEMKQAATFPGWDFVGLWKIQEGRSYPYFRWQVPPIPENQAPVALARDVRAASGAACSATVAAAAFDNGSFDPDGDPLTLAVSPAGPYPLGETLVSLTVTDPQGASATASAHITVVDETPPAVSSLSAAPASLWPANHKLVPVTISVSALDACSAPVFSRIIEVASNEPIDGLGDGDTAPDWIITGPLTVDLRAERSGNGSGRVYTITVECRDAAGNAATRSVIVSVPKSRGR